MYFRCVAKGLLEYFDEYILFGKDVSVDLNDFVLIPLSQRLFSALNQAKSSSKKISLPNTTMEVLKDIEIVWRSLALLIENGWVYTPNHPIRFQFVRDVKNN